MGVKLLQLDDAAIRERVQAQEVVVAEKKALVERAINERDLVVAQDRLAAESAADNVELAKLDLDDAPADKKRKMEIHLKQAERALAASKLQAQSHKASAEEAIIPRKKALDAASVELAVLTEQLDQCVLTAPHDGLVIFPETEQARWGLGNARVTAEGEPVLEGQTLMSIANTQQMQVKTQIHESLVHLLPVAGPGARPVNPPAAMIKVDFLGKSIDGHVQSVSTTAKQPDFFASDVKVYPVIIAIEQVNNGGLLKPGMSAEVTVRVQERKDVLRCPVQAVVHKRGRPIVYVKTGKGIEARELRLGAINDVYVEVMDGLKEGEQVSLDPNSQMMPPSENAASRQEGAAPHSAREFVVRGLRPDGDSARLTRIEKYGLTDADLRRMEATVPGLVSVVPIRLGPATFRVPGSPRLYVGRLVATTPGYAAVHDLASFLFDEDHRFLADLDQNRVGQVAVLGAELAQRLFAAEDPLGKTIAAGGNNWRVVGVLKKRPASKTIGTPDGDVYVPLQSVRHLMSQISTIRRAGSFRREEVDVHEVVVTVAKPTQVNSAIAIIRAQLERMHPGENFAANSMSGL